VHFDLSPSIAIEPGFLIKYLPSVPLSFDVNTNFIFNKVLIAGVSYRKSESIDFLLRLQVTPKLQVGYGYDYTIGEVTALSQSSHELMINYLFKTTRNNLSSPR
jgi:type IX secretion system PorP/SprF family membrane protein